MVAHLPLENWQALHQQLRGIAKRRAALDAEEAHCLRAASALQLWRKLGYVHMAEYLERELGYGPQAGTERLRVAHALGELSLVEASLGDGELSYSAVRELTRVATAETERAWIDEVRGKTMRQVEALVSGHKRGDWPDDPTTPELVNRVLRLEVTPAVFALFRDVQSAMAEEHGGRLDDSALLETLCRRALEGTAASARPAHQIALTVCESCKRGWQNGAGREIEVGPAVLDRARCDAEWIGSLDDAHPARVTSTVTPRIRRQVLARDHRRCTVPGCRSARNLDLHHVEYQSEGGSHEMLNMTTLCSGHHQQLHDGALAIGGAAPHALTFTWRVPEAAGFTAGEREARCARPSARPRIVENAATGSSVGPVSTTCVDRGREPCAGTPHAVDRRPAAAIDDDAREALITAGYPPRLARAAVASARPHVGAEAPLEHLLRAALQRCAHGSA